MGKTIAISMLIFITFFISCQSDDIEKYKLTPKDIVFPYSKPFNIELIRKLKSITDEEAKKLALSYIGKEAEGIAEFSFIMDGCIYTQGESNPFVSYILCPPQGYNLDKIKIQKREDIFFKGTVIAIYPDPISGKYAKKLLIKIVLKELKIVGKKYRRYKKPKSLLP